MAKPRAFEGNSPLTHFHGIETGAATPAPLRVEVALLMDRVNRFVTEVGGTMSDILHVKLFVADMSDFADINAVYCEYFRSFPPSR